MLLRLQNAFASMTRLGTEQERTANNLANANTIGYRRDRTFVSALNERLDIEGAPRTDRQTVQFADDRLGAIEATGNPLDAALQSEGFFVIREANGAERFTRAGRFVPDADGIIRDPQGREVVGADGPLVLPPIGGAITIAADGTIRSGEERVGKLRVVMFDDPRSLQRADGATFIAEPGLAREMDNPRVMQGHLESSNVDVIAEMTEMIQHFRLFESQQKALQTTDSVLGAITRDLGRF
jgi:flagellar basal-body rod protein FlgF